MKADFHAFFAAYTRILDLMSKDFSVSVFMLWCPFIAIKLETNICPNGQTNLYFPCTGNSGMGCYHGKFSFDQLSHLRSCLIKKLNMEGVNSMRYPPHTPKKLGWARFFILKNIDLGWIGRMALLAVLAAVAAAVLQVSYTGGENMPTSHGEEIRQVAPFSPPQSAEMTKTCW